MAWVRPMPRGRVVCTYIYLVFPRNPTGDLVLNIKEFAVPYWFSHLVGQHIGMNPRMLVGGFKLGTFLLVKAGGPGEGT